MCKEEVLDNFEKAVSDYLTIINHSLVIHYLLLRGEKVAFDELYNKFGPDVVEELDDLLKARMITKYTKQDKTSYMALDFNALVYLARSKGNLYDQRFYNRMKNNYTTQSLIDRVLSGEHSVEVVNNFVNESKKVKVKFIKGSDSNLNGIKKWDITGRKADQYKRGNWNWVRKVVDKWPESSSRKPELIIKVLVWDMGGKPVHDSLGQEFVASDLKGAKFYAKDLVASKQSIMTVVEGRVIMPFEKDQVVTFGTFEPDEK